MTKKSLIFLSLALAVGAVVGATTVYVLKSQIEVTQTESKATAAMASVQKAASSRSTAPATDDPRVVEAKAIVTKNFLDPESAQFRNVRIYQRYFDSEKIVCGEVNGKNAYGAYVGYRLFYQKGREGAIFDTGNAGSLDGMKMLCGMYKQEPPDYEIKFNDDIASPSHPPVQRPKP